jgi:hypothetical protein
MLTSRRVWRGRSATRFLLDKEGGQPCRTTFLRSSVGGSPRKKARIARPGRLRARWNGPAARLLRMPRSCPCRRRHTVGRTDRLGIDQASAPITWRFWQRRRRNQFATETGAPVAELVDPQHSRAVTCVVVRYGISVGGAADPAISDPRGLTYMAKCRDARCI